MHQPETISNPLSPASFVPNMARSRFPVWLMAALLALVTMALYWPAMRCDFINYDDNLYVTENVHVQNGLTWEGVKWAFVNPVASNWHPLTVLSHMLDCQLFGLKPWGHHLTSVLLHSLNTVLVFLLVRRLTGATWRSFFVAALFGWHPLRVESVVWVAERKDVLSTCFGLLALLTYARYVEQSKVQLVAPKPGEGGSPKSKVFYRLALVFFALGLMSKAMLVTWPFVMLLLDWWPLQRVSSFKFPVSSPGPAPASTLNSDQSRAGPRLSTLTFEKLPFFGLAAAAGVVAFVMQKQTDALAAAGNLSLGVRSGNALISYCRYLGKLFWPVDLAVFYPHPEFWPVRQVLSAGGLILGITVLFIVARRRYPFLLVGWLWFVGTLVPVIGLVQAGDQAMADRYAYFPSLGVLILTIWGGYELTRRRRQQVMALSAAGGVAIILCCGATRQQLGYWRDSETLFRHALAVTENNYLAHNNLGFALNEKGQTDEAINQFQEALRFKPDFAKARLNLGTALLKQGRIIEAINQFQEVLQQKPDHASARNNLGTAFDREGQTGEAIRQFREAIRLKPDYAEAHYNLGTALLKQGQILEAIQQLREAIRLMPDYADAHNNLGIALGMGGQIDEAVRRFQEAIRLKPDYIAARSNLVHALEMKTGSTGR
jgi:protein O-mannosyl-transferase